MMEEGTGIRNSDLTFLDNLAKELNFKDNKYLRTIFERMLFHINFYNEDIYTAEDDLLKIRDKLDEICVLITRKDTINYTRLYDPDDPKFPDARSIIWTLCDIRDRCMERHRPNTADANAPKATLIRILVNEMGEFLQKEQIPFSYYDADNKKDRTPAGKFIWSLGKHLRKTRELNIRGLHAAACEYRKKHNKAKKKPGLSEASLSKKNSRKNK